MAVTAFEVTSPRRALAPTGPARGTLRLVSDERGEETWKLPVAVTRLLQQESVEDLQTVEEALALVRDMERRAAAGRVVRLQEGRDHAAAEIEERLRLEGYGSEAIQIAIDEAKAKRVVSDVRFADSFVRTKVSAGWGEQRIRRELKARNIDVSDLPGWPDDYIDADEELERALSAARRKYVYGRDAEAKLVRFLMGRGFSRDVARTAARQVASERDEDE